jgi:hypothetical protein
LSLSGQGYELNKDAEALMPAAAVVFREGHGFFTQGDAVKLRLRRLRGSRAIVPGLRIL